jgi:hypothetical protein
LEHVHGLLSGPVAWWLRLCASAFTQTVVAEPGGGPRHSFARSRIIVAFRTFEPGAEHVADTNKSDRVATNYAASHSWSTILSVISYSAALAAMVFTL